MLPCSNLKLLETVIARKNVQMKIDALKKGICLAFQSTT